MKRIITLTSVLFLFFMTTFASADSLVKKVQLTDPTELTGTITYLDLEGGQYLLQNERGKYALLGKNSEVRNSLGKKVHLTGKMVNVEVTFYQRGNGFFQIDTLEVVGEGEDYPTPAKPVLDKPVIEKPVVEEPIVEEPIVEEPVIEEPITEVPIKKPQLGNPTEIEGKLVVDFIEGRHYELVTENGSFVLTGKTTGMEKFLDKNIVVKGAFTVGAITIWQKGEVFVVEEWSVQETDKPAETIIETEKIEVTVPETSEETVTTSSTNQTEEKATASTVTPKEIETELVKKTLSKKSTLVQEPGNDFLRNLPTIPKPPVDKMSSPVQPNTDSEVILNAAEADHFSFSNLNVSHFSVKNYEPVRFTIK